MQNVGFLMISSYIDAFIATQKVILVNMKKTITYSIVGFILFNKNNLVVFLTEDLKEVSNQPRG